MANNKNSNEDENDDREGQEEFDEQDELDQEDAEDTVSEESHRSGGVRVRRRIKIRKKIRVRKKPSVKKKLKKFGEKAFWVVIVAGFIAALIVMIVQLDIKDEKFKQSKTSGKVAK